MDLLRTTRKSRVLAPSKLPCLSGVPAVNLTAGCAHGCLYCYAQGYCSYPGRDRVVVYANLLTELRRELARRRRMPEAIYFSTASDLFQPLPEVLDLAYDVLELVLGLGIGVVFLTKGTIPKRHMELLKAHAPLVRARIGIITLERQIVRVFEPHAASPKARLRQIRQLIAAGIATQARLDPILPGVTDDPDGLHALCGALAAAGVTEISASTLFLRPAVLGTLRRRLGRSRRLGRLLAAFDSGKWMAIQTGQAPVLALPAARRRRIFDWLTAIARQYGMTVHVCACKNPDLSAGTCHLADGWAAPPAMEQQLALFAS
jgi:DNA repair photolyase